MTYANFIHSFLKLYLSYSSHSLLISIFLIFFFPDLLPDSSLFFLGYHLSFLGYVYFFHLAILSGWSSEILDNCQGSLDIWQSIWNRMGNFIFVSAHMQMMPPAHVEAIAQIPGALACRVSATQVVLGRMVIPACLRRLESQWVCWAVNVHCCVPATGLISWTYAELPVPNKVSYCTTPPPPVSSIPTISGLLSALPFTQFSHLFLPGITEAWGFLPLFYTLGMDKMNLLWEGKSSETSATARQAWGEAWCGVIFGLIVSLDSSQNWCVSYDNHY